jgi:hypothetical protein
MNAMMVIMHMYHVSVLMPHALWLQNQFAVVAVAQAMDILSAVGLGAAGRAQ